MSIKNALIMTVLGVVPASFVGTLIGSTIGNEPNIFGRRADPKFWLGFFVGFVVVEIGAFIFGARIKPPTRGAR